MNETYPSTVADPKDILFQQVRKLVDARIAAQTKSVRRYSFSSIHSHPCASGAHYSIRLGNPRVGEVCESTSFSKAKDCEELSHKDLCYKQPRRIERESSDICQNRLPENLHVPPPDPRPPNLNAACLSFAARVVIAVRDKFGGDAPKVYAAAKISRQAYSQIVSDETRPVSKRTAVRFAFALKCSPDEARTLLKSAGFAFSNSLTEDFILQACLEVNPPIWDLDAVNRLLQEYRVDFQY